MAHIETIPPEDAEGPLRKVYDAAVSRAGKVYNILRIMSLNPGTLRASMAIYLQIMRGESPLSRAQREMIATVVSRANNCFY